VAEQPALSCVCVVQDGTGIPEGPVPDLEEQKHRVRKALTLYTHTRRTMLGSRCVGRDIVGSATPES
jgi:hypothetical protein